MSEKIVPSPLMEVTIRFVGFISILGSYYIRDDLQPVAQASELARRCLGLTNVLLDLNSCSGTHCTEVRYNLGHTVPLPCRARRDSDGANIALRLPERAHAWQITGSLLGSRRLKYASCRPWFSYLDLD